MQIEIRAWLTENPRPAFTDLSPVSERPAKTENLRWGTNQPSAEPYFERRTISVSRPNLMITGEPQFSQRLGFASSASVH